MFLALALFVLRIGAEDVDHPLAPNHFALSAYFLHRCPYFHNPCSEYARRNHAVGRSVRIADRSPDPGPHPVMGSDFLSSPIAIRSYL